MATYSISAPDGKTYEITGPAGASQEQVQAEVLKQHPTAGTPKQAQAAPPAAPPQSAFDRLMGTAKDVGKGALETVGGMASGAVGSFAGNVAGLGAIPLHAAGLINTDPSIVRDNVAGAITGQPQTQTGKNVQNAVGFVAGAPGKFASDVYGGVADKLGASPAVADAVRNGAQGLGDQLPTILGTKLPEAGAARVDAAAAPKLNPVAAQTLQDASKIGIRVTPEYAGMGGSGAVAKSAEMSGSATKLQQALSKYNAEQAVPQVIKQEAGIPAGEQLTPAALDASEHQANSMYAVVRKQPKFQPSDQFGEDMKGVGVRDASASDQSLSKDVAKLKELYGPKSYTVDASTGQTARVPLDPNRIVSDVRQLRADSRVGFKSDDPETVALASAKQQVANALDAELQRQLATSAPGVGSAFLAARTQLAKLNSIRDAFNEGNGTVDVKSFAKDLDNGVPLSGGLLTLAKSYKAFPKVLQDPAKVNVGSGSMVDTALIGQGLYRLAHGDVKAGLEVAAGAARPFARGVVNSPSYQAGLVNPQAGILSKLAAKPASPLAGLLAQDPNQPNQ